MKILPIGHLVKTNPIQSQLNPKQTQYKPNTNPIPRKARMNVSSAITRNYNNEQRTMNNEQLCKTNPNKPNFKHFTYKKPIFPTQTAFVANA
jgi:hypothetical protein